MQRDTRPSFARGTPGGEGQSVYGRGSNYGRIENIGGIPTFLRRAGGFEAETSWRDSGEKRIEASSFFLRRSKSACASMYVDLYLFCIISVLVYFFSESLDARFLRIRRSLRSV